jgi:hypothetical protein
MVLLKGLRLVGGVLLMAVAIWLILSAPGFLSDGASIVARAVDRSN